MDYSPWVGSRHDWVTFILFIYTPSAPGLGCWQHGSSRDMVKLGVAGCLHVPLLVCQGRGCLCHSGWRELGSEWCRYDHLLICEVTVPTLSLGIEFLEWIPDLLEGFLALFFFFWSFYWICYNIAFVLFFGFFGCKVCGNLSSQTRDRTCIPYVGRQSLNHWATKEVPFLALFEEVLKIFNSKATTEEMKYNTTRILIQVH